MCKKSSQKIGEEGENNLGKKSMKNGKIKFLDFSKQKKDHKNE